MGTGPGAEKGRQEGWKGGGVLACRPRTHQLQDAPVHKRPVHLKDAALRRSRVQEVEDGVHRVGCHRLDGQEEPRRRAAGVVAGERLPRRQAKRWAQRGIRRRRGGKQDNRPRHHHRRTKIRASSI
jgi:hypothetical protein